MYLFADAAHDYSDNMSEQVDMVEVETEHNEPNESFSVCKNTKVVDNHSRNDKTTFEGKKKIVVIFFVRILD